jgi:hypothetical protein
MLTQLDQFVTHLLGLLRDLIRDGHGELRIIVTVPKQDKRAIVIQGGRSHRYTIPVADLETELLCKSK